MITSNEQPAPGAQAWKTASADYLIRSETRILRDSRMPDRASSNFWEAGMWG